MRLKPEKEKISPAEVFKDIYSNENEASPTVISVDINGIINIENLKRIEDYRKDRIVLETKTKKVYIYGENLSILSCKKHCAVCVGIISRIEFFRTEAQ